MATLTPKTRLEDGKRISIATGKPFTDTITSSDLQTQNPIKIPDTPTVSEAPALQGLIETMAGQTTDVFTQRLAEKQKKAEEGRTEAFTDLTSAFADARGEGALTQQAEKEAGLSKLDADLQDTNNQILQESEALRRQVEQIQTGAGTATKAQRDTASGEATRVSLRKQADLAIIQLAKQGKYDSAKAIADRAVAVQLESQKQDLELRQFIYDENKDLFTDAESKLFETQQADRQRKLDFEEFKLKSEFEQKIKQADPLYKANLLKAQKELELMGKKTRKEIEEENAALLAAQNAIPILESKISLIDGVIGSSALDSVVGTSFLSRAAGGLLGVAGRFVTGALASAPLGLVAGPVGALATGVAGGTALASQGVADKISGERQVFIASVEQLVSKEFIDNLIAAKAAGATFGALTQAEQAALTSAATKIGTWRICSDGSQGICKEGTNPVGYNVSETAFKAEMKLIQDAARVIHQRTSGQVFTSDEQDYFTTLEETNFDPSY